MTRFVVLLLTSVPFLAAQSLIMVNVSHPGLVNLTVGDSFHFSLTNGTPNTAITAYSSLDGGSFNGPFPVGTTDASGSFTTRNGTATDIGYWEEVYYSPNQAAVYFTVFSGVTPTGETTTYINWDTSSTIAGEFEPTVTGDNYDHRYVTETFPYSDLNDTCWFSGEGVPRLVAGWQ